MRLYLKEFGLIEGKRLSHIWHMTINKTINLLFITDGALNVFHVLMLKCIILKMLIEFAKQIEY